MPEASSEVRQRAARIQMVLLDVDGVLTDGRLYMDASGNEIKAFHARDGLGIRLGQRGGLLFGIISGRESSIVKDRAEELYINEVHQRVLDKASKLDEILGRTGLAADQVCFLGDDLVDVPVFHRVGLAIAPSDAAPEAREAAHHVTTRNGGDGCVREAIDLILRAKGKWDSVTGRFFRRD